MTNRTFATVARGAVKACRPKQWAKNSLVFIAPVAANALVSRGDDGIELHADNFLKTLLAFAVFSMVASATYLINDSVDVESDRRHPTKCKRPIAAGIITVPFAVTLAVVLTVAGLGLAAWLNLAFCIVVALYAVQTTLYSFWWKREPVLDVVALSGGFILRLLGGAYAIDVDVSTWFFIISCFGALFIAAGKRLAEKRELGGKTEGIRKTLAVYTEGYLQFLQGVAAAIVLIAYVMWAFERADAAPNAEIWFLLSILPFLIAILRYGLLVELGKGSAPEEILLSDRQMRVMGLLWVGIVGVGFYVAG
ncbi:MAG: decaprenyl-phosphate phosphoribosyltransferase [Actinobacteria bacterium]|nr:decaprenyl-phosphate phosphoribosyltransferase [Actinomycetota bacterium]